MKKKIWLDAGHGGKDAGATNGAGLCEKNVVLKLALKLGKYLTDHYEVEVGYSRKEDIFLELTERTALANKWGADYFLSLHNNAANTKARGFETFIHTNASATSVAVQNVLHAELMAFLKPYGITDRGKKRANYAVLRTSKMPSALIEYLFIDNPQDNQYLQDDSFLQGLAEATAKGLEKALGLKKKTPKPTNEGITNSAKYHPIQKGDTLCGIAKKYGVTVQKLQALNPKINPNRLQIGEKIRYQ